MSERANDAVADVEVWRARLEATFAAMKGACDTPEYRRLHTEAVHHARLLFVALSGEKHVDVKLSGDAGYVRTLASAEGRAERDDRKRP